MHNPQKSKVVTLISLLGIATGIAVIIGWVFNLPGLENIFPQYDSMKFNTALCFLLLGIALLTTQFENKKNYKLLFVALSALVALIGALSLLQDVFHLNIGMDQLVVVDKDAMAGKYPFPGRMAANVSLSFLLSGLAFIGFSFKGRFTHIVSQYFLHAVTAISAIAIIGYLYGLSLFYKLTFAGSMAIHTAILFFLLSIIATLLHPALGITKLFTGNLVGNKMARRLFILIVFMVVIFGSLRVQTEHYHLLSTEVGVSLLALCFLAVSLVIIWHTANWLNKIDAERYEAEEEIKVMNEELEERVEERSSELYNLLEKYKESESKFRAAFEFSAIGMALASPEGRWLKVNKRLCDIVGYSEQELLSMTFVDITHPDDINVHIIPTEKALSDDSSGPARIEKRYIRKDGAIVWVSVNFAAVRDNKGRALYLVSQIEDITEHKEAEQARQLIIENEERLRAIFDNVDGATSLLDTDLRLIVFNNAFSQKQSMLTGREPQVGDELYGHLSPEEKQQRYEIVNRVLKGNKETFDVTYNRNGENLYFRISFAPVIVDGKVTAISSYSIDLTASKEADNRIRKADARFRAIVESVFVGIKLNDAEGNIIYRSPSMQAINGWTDEEMDRNFFKLTHPDDLELVKEAHRETQSTPGKAVNIVYRILHKNGYYIWIESMLCNKLSDPDLGAIITVTRDITERKIVEDQLKKSEEKYHSLIEHASDAIYLLDFKGNITDANQSMCKMTGYTRDELLQLNIEELIDREQLKTDPVSHGPRPAGQSVMRERRLVRKNGQVFDVEINVKSFADDKVLVIARDITGRKQMEAGLREAELKFRTLAEKSIVGVYISQRERFTYLNPRFAEIFGYEVHELINTPGSTIDLIINEKDREKVRSSIEARNKGEIDHANYEVKGIKKDGTNNLVEFYGNRVIIDGEPSIIGTMLDITERKKAEERILREKTLSETVINSLPEVFYLRNNKGEFLRWNKNFEKITGYSADEIKNLNAKFQIAEEDRDAVRQAVEKMVAEGHATVEARVITKDGNKVPFLITITPLVYEDQECVMGIAIDITQRLKAEEELRSSEQKYKLLFESNPQPLSMISKDDLSIIAVNDALSELYGYTKDELLSAHASIFRAKEDIGQQLEIFRKKISGVANLGVVKHIKKDGAVMFVSIIAHDIVFEGHRVRLSLITDVTEKLKAEEKLQKSEANLKAIMDTTDTAYALLDKKLNVIAYNHMALEFVKRRFNHQPANGDQLIDFLPRDRFPRFVKNADEVLKGNNIIYEINYPQPDGSQLWYYIKLFPITNEKKEIFGLMLSIADITERKNAEESLKAAYNLIQDHITSIKDMAWKQSHLIRSPVANLKGLAALLQEDPADGELVKFINIELDRLDAVIISMAEDASNHDF